MLRLLAPVSVALAVTALTAGAASAVPCGPSTCAPLGYAVSGSGVLLARPHGQHGPLVGYDLADAHVTSRLPDGVLSADGRRFVAASQGLDSTLVGRYDPATAAPLGSMRLAGTFVLGAVSSNGRFAALSRGETNPEVAVVDLDASRVVRTVHLRGRWDVDALSRDGRRLYLLEYAANGNYLVRVYEAGRGLVPGAITDPREAEPMTGIPWSSIGSPDGRWQLTLYLKNGSGRTEPFVHALSLTGAHAACIDLPGGDFMSAGRYALVLAPNGRTLYAANPSLGVVATVDLRRQKVVSTVRIPWRGAVDTQMSAAFGVLSPDAKTLYFTGGRGVLAYDTAGRTLRTRYDAGAVGGLSVDPASGTLLVVRPDGTTARIRR
jgi:hypothetical protein